jgi:ATP-dependent DNA helicase DinG
MMLKLYDNDIEDLAVVCAHSGIKDDRGNRIYAISATIIRPDSSGQEFSSLVRYAHFSARERYYSNLSKDAVLSAPSPDQVQADLETFLQRHKFILVSDNRGNIGAVQKFCGHRRVIDLGFAAEFFLPFMESFTFKRIWEYLFKKQRDKLSFSTAEIAFLSAALIKHICGTSLNDKTTPSAPAIRYYLKKSNTLFGKFFVHIAKNFKRYFGEMFDPCTIHDTGRWKTFLKKAASPSRKKESDNSHKPVSAETVEQIFRQMAESGRGYKFRPEQSEYARHVADALNDAAILTIEAGTGTGKTQGYLIPVLEFLRLNPKAKIAISTYTKSLQEQIFERELALTKDIFKELYRDISVTLLKGKSGYICAQKLDNVYEEDMSGEKLLSWLYFVNIVFHFRHADRDSVGEKIRFYLNNPYFRQLFSETSARTGCTAGHLLCPAQVITAEAQSANLIITNHHKLALLDTDPLLVGLFRNYVIDEANHFEHAVRNALGDEIFSAEISDTLDYLDTAASRILEKASGAHVQSITDALAKISIARVSISELRTMLGSIAPNAQPGMVCELETSHPVFRDGAISNAADNLKSALKDIAKSLEFIKDADECRMLKIVSRTAERMRNSIKQLSEYGDALNTIQESFKSHNTVIAYQVFAKNWILTSQQVEVGDTIRRHIYEKKDSVVYTAATLCYKGSFDNFKDICGMNQPVPSEIDDDAVPKQFRFAIIDSPFPKDAMEIIVPDKAVSGAFNNKAAWLNAVTEVLPELIRKNKGRTLVLFSSYSDLKIVTERVAASVKHTAYPLLVQQNSSPTANLCEEFRDIRESVLFGVDTFWYGVDFKGDTLTQVIITRIPYPAPYDALQMARKKSLSAKGYWNRYHYDTHIKLRQGIGRLIRSETDRGKVIILDSRFKTDTL